MSTLTIRLPEDKHTRLRNLAKARGISVNKLMEEVSTVMIAQHDTEVRFRALAVRGSAKRGLELLDKLDRAFAKK
jgi:predicted DNA-binding ribbon-helix-helix protein